MLTPVLLDLGEHYKSSISDWPHLQNEQQGVPSLFSKSAIKSSMLASRTTPEATDLMQAEATLS